MTKPKSTRQIRRLLQESNEEMLTRLRFKIQELEEQVRKERRRADQHAEEVACMRQEQRNAAQRWNGVGR